MRWADGIRLGREETDEVLVLAEVVDCFAPALRIIGQEQQESSRANCPVREHLFFNTMAHFCILLSQSASRRTILPDT